MLRAVLSVLVLVPLGGCPAPAEVDPAGPIDGAPVVTDGTPAEPSPELAEARQRWAEAGLDAYEMTLQRICFCPSPDYTGPFEVVVRNGAIETVRLNGATVEAERGETVEALFELIEEAYERGAERVEVEYDEALGYPTSVGIDYSTQMADEEIAYRVSDLHAADR